MNCSIALCGLTPRDQRLLEIVINRPGFTKHQLRAADSKSVGNAEIAIYDLVNPQSASALDALRQTNPSIVPIAISDDATAPSGVAYWVPRVALLVRVFSTLETLIEREFSGARTAVSPQTARVTSSAAQSPTATHSSTTAARTNAPETPSSTVKPINAPATSTPLPASATHATGEQKLQALVVDDSLAVRQQLAAGLERLGFQCTMAENAMDAQDKLVLHAYDLTLLDVVMPGLDGYDLCRVIKRDRSMRRMPVIMLTSRSSPFDRARGTLAGCDAYLTKPITWEGFSESIEKTMLKSMHRDQAALVARGFISAKR